MQPRPRAETLGPRPSAGGEAHTDTVDARAPVQVEGRPRRAKAARHHPAPSASRLLLIIGLVLLFVLPTPWNVIVLLACSCSGSARSVIWRFARKKKVQTGAQTLDRPEATVIAPCKPLGQVRLAGESEIWRARCAEGAEQGETVTIVGIDQLTLIVER